MLEKLRKFLFQNLAFGFLALIPIFGSIYVFVAVLDFSDNFLFNLLPYEYRPHNLFGLRIPGLGIILTVTIICTTGILTRNFLGKQVFTVLERVIRRIPIMGAFYNAIRQLTESVFMDRSNAFRKVVMIEFPNIGMYTVAFVTHSFKNSVPDSKEYEEIYTIFVPTTPNPTSGFFMVIPDWATYDLNISVQEAFRLIVSGGILAGGASDMMPKIEKAIHEAAAHRRQKDFPA